jgi:hypothetical protein
MIWNNLLVLANTKKEITQNAFSGRMAMPRFSWQA